MADKIMTQVRFRKALWICPSCQQEDVEDLNVGGGNTYEHNCSKCDTWFNSFKNYDGCLTILEEDYKELTPAEVETEKTKMFDDWVYGWKNPPTYVEPSQSDYEQMYLDRIAEAQRYLEGYAKTATEQELANLKSQGESSINGVEKP